MALSRLFSHDLNVRPSLQVGWFLGSLDGFSRTPPFAVLVRALLVIFSTCAEYMPPQQRCTHFLNQDGAGSHFRCHTTVDKNMQGRALQ